jgi:AraC-like DNA-binding protein
MTTVGTIEDHLRWTEEATGGTVCFHDLSGRLEPVVGPARLHHRTAPCVAMKTRDPRACSAVEVMACQGHLAQAPAGFWKRCHAGWMEVYVPLRQSGGRQGGDRQGGDHQGGDPKDGDPKEGELLGALFLGPWRWPGPALPGEVFPAGEALPNVGLRVQPPLLTDPEAMPRILAAAMHLGAWLEQRLGHESAILATADPGAAIMAFARRTLGESPSLMDLATYLGVSTTTASRLVRRHHGTTWPGLLTRLRLERAQRLLLSTEASLQLIAVRCGLVEAGYLHRLFRRHHDCTPSVWRARARDDGSVHSGA